MIRPPSEPRDWLVSPEGEGLKGDVETAPFDDVIAEP